MIVHPPRLLVVVPSGLAVDRERRRRLAASTAGVVLDPQVMAFGRLEHLLLEDLPDAPAQISDIGREMLLTRLLADSGLTWAGPEISAPGVGLRRALTEIIDQIRPRGPDINTLADLGREILPAERLAGLVRLHREYEAALVRAGFEDQAGLRRLVAAKLSNGWAPPCLDRFGEIAFQGFTRLTPWQADLIVALTWARPELRIDLELACPDWAFDLEIQNQTDHAFIETLELIRRFEIETNPDSNFNLDYAPTREHAPLAWTKDVFRPGPPEADGTPEGLALLAAPGRYQEVEEIGRRIRALLDLGAAPEEIGVACRDLGTYGPLFEDVFRRYRLPLYFRRGDPLLIQAPARAALALLRLADSHWERELILDLLASPYIDLGLTLPWTKAADLSARAGVTDARAGGGWEVNLERLARTRPADREPIADLLAGLRRLRTILAPLTKPQTWSQFSDWIKTTLETLGLPHAARSGPPPYRHRDAAAWIALLACLEDLARAAIQAGLAGESFPVRELTDGLRQALANRNVSLGGALGSGVRILSIFDLHGLAFEHLFLAGLNEGELPRVTPENSLMDDVQARALNRAIGRRIFLTTSARYRQEELVLYHALSAARASLTLSYCRLDEEGRLRLPSPLWEEVLDLWPRGTVVAAEPEPGPTVAPDLALTPEELFGSLAVACQPSAPPLGSLEKDILTALAGRPNEKNRWLAILDRVEIETARTIGLASWSGQVGPEVLQSWLASLKRHEGAPLLSPTWLETFGQCPFAFWAREVLGLEPAGESTDEIAPMDEGSLLHRILRDFLTQIMAQGRLPLKADLEEQTLLATITEQICREVEKMAALGRRPLWIVRRRILDRLLQRWLAGEAARDDGYRPTLLEWTFSPAGPASPLEVPLSTGGRLFIQGRVDRIDLGPEGARVLDYKDSANHQKYAGLLKPENLGRTSFQAPLYQVAVARNLGRPTVAGWILLRDHGRNKPRYSPPSTDPIFSPDPELRPTGPVAGTTNFFHNLETTWLAVTGGAFGPTPDNGPCDFCEFATVCRPAGSEPSGNNVTLTS